jgi:hypothetical protein
MVSDCKKVSDLFGRELQGFHCSLDECHWVGGSGCSEAMLCLRISGSWNPQAPKMEALHCFEMLGSTNTASYAGSLQSSTLLVAASMLF